MDEFVDFMLKSAESDREHMYLVGMKHGYNQGRHDQMLGINPIVIEEKEPEDPECICGEPINFGLQYCRNCDKKLFPF